MSKTDGTTPETELDMLKIVPAEHIETLSIMFRIVGMTPRSVLEILQIVLERHTEIIRKMLRIDGTTPRIGQDALTETLAMMLKIDGRTLRTELRMLETEPSEHIDEQETMLLTSGKIRRMPSLISGRTPKIMLRTNGIPSSTRPTTCMNVQRIVPTTLSRALEIDGTTTATIQTKIIIDL